MAIFHKIVGKGSNRKALDVYATPPEAIIGLLEKEVFEGNILDPAVGEGNILITLKWWFEKNKGYTPLCYGYDLREDDSIYGKKGVDFLSSDSKYPQIMNIIANPPFCVATEFILKAKSLATHKVAILLKLDAMTGGDRYDRVWSDTAFPLKKVICFSKRLDFEKKGAPTMEHMWLIFDKSHRGEPTVTWFDNRVVDTEGIPLVERVIKNTEIPSDKEVDVPDGQ